MQMKTLFLHVEVVKCGRSILFEENYELDLHCVLFSVMLFQADSSC